MAVITPTITTDDPHLYRDQLEQIAQFADGVHIDFADGVLAPTSLLPLDRAWRSDDIITHIHVMYQNPLEYVDDIVALEADLVVLHAEAEDLKEVLEALNELGVRTGVALLPETSVADLQELEVDELFDHILVFGGHLGYQGGEADLTQLHKIRELKGVYPDVEIGWDGGINDQNVAQLKESGVEVLNVGGYIKNAESPKKAYETLCALIQS